MRDYTQMAAGAVLVAALALIVDLVFALVQRYAVSPGLTGRVGRASRPRNRRAGAAAAALQPTP